MVLSEYFALSLTLGDFSRKESIYRPEMILILFIPKSLHLSTKIRTLGYNFLHFGQTDK